MFLVNCKLLVVMAAVFALAVPARRPQCSEAQASETPAKYSVWKHSGLMYIITTPSGANLPSTALEKDFPLLVRLHKDFFDFNQAMPNGEDVRFSANSNPLSYQIERWDAAGGNADIWVRIPLIKGNAQQAIRMHWGNDAAFSESNGEKVFQTTKGFAGVWHLSNSLEDATSNNLDGFDSPGKPTINTLGVVGDAREFGINKFLVIRPPGTERDRRVTCMPSGNADRTMSAWVNPENFESHNWASATIGGWGEPEPGVKPNMGLSYMSMTGIGQPRFHLYGFDPRAESKLPMNEWRHVALSVSQDMVRFYVDGVLDRTINNDGGVVSKLGTLRTPESTAVDLGDHGNKRGPFNGVLDEVRFESIARSGDWLKLCFENQKPLQSLVGPLVQDGDVFSVSRSSLTLQEGASVELSVKAAGARKLYWLLQDGDTEQLLSVDRLNYRFHAGRVAKSKTVALQIKAVFPTGTKSKIVPISIEESIPNPEYTMNVPRTWNGRDDLEILPAIKNLAELKLKGADDLNYSWTVSGMATISEVEAGKLVLKRAENSGVLTVNLALDNGGAAVSMSSKLQVAEPKHDSWIKRLPSAVERPVDHQFYARDDHNQGTVYCRGTLQEEADFVFLKLYAGDKLIDTKRQRVTAGNKYALSTKLKAGLFSYRTEFGVEYGGVESILDQARDLVCGDVFVIQGQSNAEAWTDERVVHPFRSSWLRSFGTPSAGKDRARDAVWGNALSFNGGENHHHFQIGYWGVELGRLLIEKHKIPVCFINGAQGGTRIDQHQRNDADPTDVSSIYGRLLWRLQQARLTHGVRAVLWHQGENDQGVSGATGTFGWVNYQDYFVRLTAAWKQDYPNIKHYYIHQIWPGACGARSVDNDRLREIQRQLPGQYSNMSIMSTLGIRPGGGCHFLAEGYAMMARQLFPLLNKYSYGLDPNFSVTPPNIQSISYTSARRDEVKLTFDQNVKWDDEIAGRFYLDDAAAELLTVSGAGNTITLKLAGPSTATKLSYIKGGKWKQKDAIILGENNIAALTFWEFPIRAATLVNGS